MTPAHRAPAAHHHILGLQTQSLSLPSGEIRYIDEGIGPPILLLHGAPVTSLGFLRVIRELRSSHRVIAPDLPGFGGSTVSASFAGTLAGYARFVEEFCGALGLRDFFVYVNDSSGSFGLRAAATLAPSIAGLVVASTVPLPLSGRAWLVKLVLKYVMSWGPVRFFNRRFNLLPWLVATVVPFLRPFSAEERRTLVAEFDEPDKRDRILEMFRQMGHDDRFMQATAQLVRERLAEKPALVLYGQFDPMRLIGGVSRFKRMFPGAAVRIIAFEEHFPILASGTAVGRIVHQWMATAASHRSSGLATSASPGKETLDSQEIA